MSDDDTSALVKARARNPRFQANTAPTAVTSAQSTTPLVNRVGTASTVRLVARLEPRASFRNYALSPNDFGQARMAALGWLTSLAQEERPPRDREFIDGVRTAALKTPHDLHALWNWFYLCLVRFDNAGAFSAARELSIAAPTDPQALWAYLRTLGGRQTALGTRYYVSYTNPRAEGLSPLSAAELDHLLACYRSLRALRPELAEAEILQNVDNELKWANRSEQRDAFYHDVLAGSTALGQIAGAFSLAAERGDVDGLIQLSERYDRLHAGRTTGRFTTGTFTFTSPVLAMCQAMGRCADRKAYAEVLRLVDYNVTAARRRLERQSPSAAARARRAAFVTFFGRGASVRSRIWVGSGYKVFPIGYPQANEYLDGTVISVLHSACELYKRDDLLSDLTSHFRARPLPPGPPWTRFTRDSA